MLVERVKQAHRLCRSCDGVQRGVGVVPGLRSARVAAGLGGAQVRVLEGPSEGDEAQRSQPGLYFAPEDRRARRVAHGGRGRSGADGGGTPSAEKLTPLLHCPAPAQPLHHPVGEVLR